MKLYGFDAIEAFRQALRETHPKEILVADKLITWGIKKGLEQGFESSKRQLRFRLPSPSHDGRSVFCLNPQVRNQGRTQPPDVDVELQWILKHAAFRGESETAELSDRLMRVPGWDRPPRPRPDLPLEGFPNVWLGGLEDAGAMEVLLGELAWIVDHLRGRCGAHQRVERCPHCGQKNRVVPGSVRCGRCHRTFDVEALRSRGKPTRNDEGSAASGLRLGRGLYEQIVEHARTEAPNMCCGLVATRDGEAVRVYTARNAKASPLRFEIDHFDQLRIMVAIEDAGLDLGAIYYSQSGRPPYPSQTTIDLAAYPELLYIIVALGGAQPEVRAFNIRDGHVTDAELIVDG